VLPANDVPSASVALDQIANPLPAIMQSPEYPATVAFFAGNPASLRSLVSGDTQALLFTLIRNLQAKCVVEIGSFQCGTAEAMCRALHSNGDGVLFTVDPFGAERAPGIIRWWPDELQAHVRFFPLSSADFFMEMERVGLHPDLVFVDGNHDYEFALFDIQCAARRLTRGGFIVIDNISQSGPFLAAVDFLRANPDWIDCGRSPGDYSVAKAFDKARISFHNTDMMVLRAPATWAVNGRPMTFGEQPWRSNVVHGLHLALASELRTGVLSVQCVVRGFGATEHVEIAAEADCEVDGQSPIVSASFEPPIMLQGEFIRVGVEPWLLWRGDAPLRLIEPPSLH
jgi:predicted O-methyltransferase YrrM